MSSNKVNCLDHGFVELVGVFPEIDTERAITRAARVSYGGDLNKQSSKADIALISYLLENSHTSPFEMVEFCFHICMPIFVARQHIRHRTANVNEYSMRYKEAGELLPGIERPWHVPVKSPEDIRIQSKSNKQMSSDEKPDESRELAIMNAFQEIEKRTQEVYKLYEDLTTMGVAREQARVYLPLATYTRMYWKMDLHNLLHYIKLRIHPHAQEEIRVYAQAMLDLIKPYVPNVINTFMNARVESITYTSEEIKAIKNSNSLEEALELLGYKTARRKDEFTSKYNSIK